MSVASRCFVRECVISSINMKYRLISFLVLTVCLSALFACSPSHVEVPEGVLFETDSIPYRIPALAQLSDGRLLALADYRPCGSDIGYGRVDIHGVLTGMRGNGWSGRFVLAEGTGEPGMTDCGFGDAALVADRESEEVLVLTVCGNTPYGHHATTRENPNRVALFRSHDNCDTWEPWTEITESVYSLFDNSSFGCIQSCFATSGRIFQSRRIKEGSHYRIYVALTARPNGNRVIYSDDFGRSWEALGGPDALPAPYGDEAKCEELPDGSLVISSRTYGGRFFNIFRYSDVKEGEGSWGNTAMSDRKVNGCNPQENSCNGELLFVPAVRNSDGHEVVLALQSLPLGPGRRAVGIYYKEVTEDMSPESLAADWKGPYRVTDKPSAYSTMIQLMNGEVAFYYEEADSVQINGYDLKFLRMSLSSITDDAYAGIR